MYHSESSRSSGPARTTGLTLIELLVTLAIFSAVTIVLTSSLLTLVSLRSQSTSSQQLNDEFRLAMDSMERDITAGETFVTNCNAGLCDQIQFTVATRPDLNAYLVVYRLNNGVIEKGQQRNDGACATLVGGTVPEECFHPITSEDVTIDTLSFAVDYAPTGAQVRPLVTTSISGRIHADTSEEQPLEYSGSFAPRTSQDPGGINVAADNTDPEIFRLESAYEGTSASNPSCYVSDQDPNVGVRTFDPQNYVFPAGQANYTLWTDCDMVELTWFAQDIGSGIEYVRYYSDTYVPAAGMYPNGDYYGINGQLNYTAVFDDIALKPGVAQQLTAITEDTAGNAKYAYVVVHQVIPPVAPNPTGMTSRVELSCPSNYVPRGQIEVHATNPSQHYIRLYRCAGMGCTPNVPVDQIQELELRNVDRWYNYPGGSARSSIDWTTFDDINFLSDTYYRYGYVVFDPTTGLTSPLVDIMWDPNDGGVAGNLLYGIADAAWFAANCTAPPPPPPPECSDGADNDGDGFTDYQNGFGDPHCTSDLDNSEAPMQCEDDIDNDGDGRVDHSSIPFGGFPTDPGCTSPADNSEGDPQCNDTFDNDGDGFVDYPADEGCTSASDNNETNPQCIDNIDNDGDGRIDHVSVPFGGFPTDPGCSSTDDNNESDPQCNDTFDNDGDGKRDYTAPGGYVNDPGCYSANDDDETDPRCMNGIDDDGDGLYDWNGAGISLPDPGCIDQWDNDEYDAPPPPTYSVLPVASDVLSVSVPVNGTSYISTNTITLSYTGIPGGDPAAPSVSLSLTSNVICSSCPNIIEHIGSPTIYAAGSPNSSALYVEVRAGTPQGTYYLPFVATYTSGGATQYANFDVTLFVSDDTGGIN